MTTLNQLKKSVRKKYFAIGTMESPAFPNEQIHFLSFGFQHFFREKAKGPLRPIKEIYIRLSLFDDALDILTQGTVTPKYSVKRNIHYWTFKKLSKTEGKMIEVTVSRLKQKGKLQYLSVTPKW